MIAFSILSEDVKQIQVWKSRKKCGLFAASQIVCFFFFFSKTCTFAHFYLIFLGKINQFVIHEVQAFNMVFNF